MSSTRTETILELRRELLGPRDGPHEQLPLHQLPSNEYVTGVLVPATENPDRDPDAESVTLSGSSNSEEGEEVALRSLDDDISDAGSMFIPGDVSPTLDPRLRPRSMGLSFLVKSETAPILRVCATWARYVESGGVWVRYPRFAILDNLSTTSPGSTYPCPGDDGVRIHLRSRRKPEGWRVSLFLVNETAPRNAVHADDDELVFQPELRVNLVGGAELVPMAFRGIRGDDESESQALLYRNRKHYARGHLVGTYWKEVDPERAYDGSSEANPFTWTDGILILSNENREEFTHCDLRTDYLPLFSIAAPEFRWDNCFGTSPNMVAKELAQKWQRGALTAALGPLVEGYARALNEKRTQELPATVRDHPHAGAALLSDAERSCDRMRRGLSILESDENVRLAFCFMNEVMDRQRTWAGRVEETTGSGLKWYPFQMAFILEALEGVVNPSHPDRNVCDLLWVPTGGGKTEAYLGLAVLVLALRRLGMPPPVGSETSAGGTSVLSRYTLRLLTIQQFRRALICITAAELLRVAAGPKGIGWRPSACDRRDSPLWGGTRFSLGLWVGSSVTPNNLVGFDAGFGAGTTTYIAGALDILRGMKGGISNGKDRSVRGDPAQVLDCPCCGTALALGPDGLAVGKRRLSLVLRSVGVSGTPSASSVCTDGLSVQSIEVTRKGVSNSFSVSIEIETVKPFSPEEFDNWVRSRVLPSFGADVTLASTLPSRPGYFIRTCPQKSGSDREIDFEIHCPNWKACESNDVQWWEDVPVSINSEGVDPHGPPLSRERVVEPYSLNAARTLSFGCPIPAYTVDDQIYHRCPSMVVATVDKFARLPFEPRAGAIFGNVDYYHSRLGYYRVGVYRNGGSAKPHPNGFRRGKELHRTVIRFAPPDLIIQDELHLIEGPLGSMVGCYEWLIDTLSSRRQGQHTRVAKIVASTATIRMAREQVSSLFSGRTVAAFPPPLLDESNSFFSRREDRHPLDAGRPGRVYLGVCCPGRAQTMVITRIWSALLQEPYVQRSAGRPAVEVDRFWTLVGYFNAIREMAGVLALFRQDIPERMAWRYLTAARPIHSANRVELSSLAASERIPSMLGRLAQTIAPGPAADAAFATSMFGTGVDVKRLSLMVVHGQPKVTSSYIQATGRVGREGGGLVVTFLPASRPRDLDHYENFVSYHQALYRHVEPITVAPFSPRVLDRSVGPLIVGLLRNASAIDGVPVDHRWAYDENAPGIGPLRMATQARDPEVVCIPLSLESRNAQQPVRRQAPGGSVMALGQQLVDRWNARVQMANVSAFRYDDSPMLHLPRSSVVLGDEQHDAAARTNPQIVVVYKRAPNSLREVESTTTFGGQV